MSTKLQAAKELAMRELEKRHEKERGSLYEFLQYYWLQEKKEVLDQNWHIEEICRKLEDVFYGRIKRLMINIPPRSLKTEIVSIAFPAWCMGKRPKIKFMGISYSSGLAQDNSSKCRAMYLSDSYRTVFPRANDLKEDQNTKQYRVTEEGAQYYASGSDGTITGKGCDIMVIDDPLKPDDAMSDLVRTSVNNNYDDTLKSRLNDKQTGAIVIIMQRLHDDDLCGYLLTKEEQGIGDKWEKLVIPAIAEQDEKFRNKGESFFEKRFPLELLHVLKTENPQTFSSQYQQNPVNKETQEFHEERFRYHGTEGTPTPSGLRVFTAVDPAFKQNQENDNTSIMTVGFLEDKAYILEYTAGKFSADVMQEKIIYHIGKRKPEKVGIEAFQAQSMIVTFLKNELQKRNISVLLEEIKQTGDKLSKIRKLVYAYRNGLIYHKIGMDELENELKRFPRGRHDDIIDSLQMVYELYELQPNSTARQPQVNITWDSYGRPIIS